MTMPRKSQDDLRERFILWLAGKPVDEVYDWNSITRCACSQFIRETLVRDKLCDPIQASQVWQRFNKLAQIEPRTYGALCDRARISGSN
jgi:hypothetical protein